MYYALEDWWRSMPSPVPLSSWYTLALLICLLAITLSMYAKSCRRNLPPGPIGLPILGYLPFLGKVAYRKLHELSNEYGQVFSLYLGRRLVVVLNSIEAVQEALSNPAIMDRPPDPPNHLMPDSVSLSISNGAVWKEQRNFAVQVLRKFGMGKEAIEERIQAEIVQLEKKIDAQNGRPMNLTHLITPSVSNIILSLLTAKEDPEGRRRALVDSVLQIMTLYFRPTRLHAYFPGLRRWMATLKIWGYDKVEVTMTALSKLIWSEIEYHKNSLDPNCVRDYIDEFLLAKKRQKSTFTDEMLRGNVQSLLGAGSTPSRATLEWCLVAVAMFPEIQDRVHSEITEALGNDRPTWASRHQTPYTMAVILEVMRHYTVIPISMLRMNSRDCRIGEFDIPAGTIIMTNIWGVHHNPKHWDRPHDFCPERFLKDGDLFKPAAFIPFSYGKRNCPGEDLAWVEVYLYFVTLVQRYKILPEDGKCGFKTLLGIANMAVPDNIRMVLSSPFSNERSAIIQSNR